jgi:hypothetical protein
MWTIRGQFHAVTINNIVPCKTICGQFDVVTFENIVLFDEWLIYIYILCFFLVKHYGNF